MNGENEMAAVVTKNEEMHNDSIPLIYTPKINEEHASKIDKNDLEGINNLDAITENDGLIHVKLEDKVVIGRIAKDLYGNPASGFREIFNNEARQCRIAKKQGFNPKIEITLDPVERKLIIHGIDSMGMSSSKFRHIFTVLGRSDNFDSEEVGQFGLGRAAYMCLSDVMILETYSRESHEKYAVLGKGGTVFEKMPTPDLTDYGTRVSLTLRNDVDLVELVSYIREAIRFSKIDVYLVLENPIEGLYKGRGVYQGIDAGIEHFKPMTEKEFLNGLLDGQQTSWFEINNEDYYFIASSARISAKEDSYTHDYLVGVPVSIGNNKICETFSDYILNIKNERKFQPTADRERLTDESVSIIKTQIENELVEIMSSIKIRTVDDYLKSPYKHFVRMGYLNNTPDETVNFHDFLGLKIDELIQDKNSIWTKEWTTMSSVIDSYDSLFYVKQFSVARLNAIKKLVPNAKIILLQKIPHERHEELMHEYGVKSLTEYLHANKIKITSERKQIDVIVHYGGTRSFDKRSEHTDAGLLTNEDIKIPDECDMRTYINVLRNYKTKYRLVKDDKRLVDEDGDVVGISLSDFIKQCESEKYETLDGIKTGKQLKKFRGSQIVYFDKDHMSKYKKYLTMDLCKTIHPEANHVLLNPSQDKIFKLAILLTYCQNDEPTKLYAEKEIGAAIALTFGIKYDGHYLYNIGRIEDMLSSIDKQPIRELYAMVYDKIYYDNSWYLNSTDNNNKERKEIDSIFTTINVITKDISENSDALIVYHAYRYMEKYISDVKNKKYIKSHHDKMERVSRDYLQNKLKELENSQDWEKAMIAICKYESPGLVIDKISDIHEACHNKYQKNFLMSSELDSKVNLNSDLVDKLHKITGNGYTIVSAETEIKNDKITLSANLTLY